jgi:hypothetical protein
VAQRSRIFRHLTHADSSITPKHGGTGLGVVTCSQLVVALMGDGIEVDLRCPSGRSQPEMPARSDLTPVLSAGADGARRPALLAEDNPVDQQEAIRLFAGARNDFVLMGVDAAGAGRLRGECRDSADRARQWWQCPTTPCGAARSVPGRLPSKRVDREAPAQVSRAWPEGAPR